MQNDEFCHQRWHEFCIQTEILDEPWHLVCVRVTPDYDVIEDFQADITRDIETALNTNIRWKAANRESKG